MTLASAPIDVLTADLKLDDGQKKRVEAIQNRLEKVIQGATKSDRGTDPSAMFSKMTDMLTQADREIDAELTADQKPLAMALLKKLSLLRTSGLPPELSIELKLTDEQLKSLEAALPDIKLENKERNNAMMAAARSGNAKKAQGLMQALGAKVSMILTKDQKTLIERYRKKHPQTMVPMMDFGGF